MPGCYRVSPEAVLDVRKILTYTALRWSVEQSERYAAVIKDGLRKVASRPLLGAAWLSGGGVLFRRSRVGSHVIFYTIDPDGIPTIRRILHKSMNFPEHLN